jgi:hypothetical protein
METVYRSDFCHYPMKKSSLLPPVGIKKVRMISQPKPAFVRHYQLPRSVEAALVLARTLNFRPSSPCSPTP